MRLNTIRSVRNVKEKEAHPGRTHFLKVLESHTAGFLDEHDVDPGNFVALNWPIKDYRGMKLYCEFLSRKRILNCTPYCLMTTGKQIVSQGFDIKEDELYTLQCLK